MHSTASVSRLSWWLSFLAVIGLACASARGPSLSGASAGEESDERVVAKEATSTLQRAQHLARLGAARWHAEGTRGRGVKVAILDSGFRGWRDQLGKSLPAQVTARSFRKDGSFEARDSQHGILCAEVVHALAPDAELLFANWEADEPESFVEAVRWARDQGAKVMTCSVIMPSFSDGEGGGPVHEALTHALAAEGGHEGALCFASAGNTAERHWAGRYRAGRAGCHEWEPGQSDNVLTPWGDERVSVELCCGAGAAYDVTVLDRDTATEAAHSFAKDHASQSCTRLRFNPAPGHTYAVRVRLARGEPGSFHLVALHSGLGTTTAKGSVAFPADGPEVVAVGAVDRDGHRASYSSCGPNSARPKPDLVAPVPFPGLSRAKPFSGTSAASPQAAGAAALLWSRHLDWSAERVRTVLQTSARDLGPVGHDCETGYGMVYLP